MNRAVIYSDKAKQDLRDIYAYIAYTLQSPVTALNQLEKILDATRALDKFPMRYPLYSEEPWYSLGLRFFPVDNYLVYYIVNESEKIVNVVRIMYKARDIKKQLEEPTE